MEGRITISKLLNSDIVKIELEATTGHMLLVGSMTPADFANAVLGRGSIPIDLKFYAAKFETAPEVQP